MSAQTLESRRQCSLVQIVPLGHRRTCGIPAREGRSPKIPVHPAITVSILQFSLSLLKKL